MKKLLIGAILLVVAVIVLIFLTFSNLGPIVKRTINKLGPQITKTDLSVADVGISILSGEAKIKQFILGNPKGFSTSNAMQVGSVYVDLDEGSITGNPIVINKIEIIAPQIAYEKKGGTDNFQVLLKNIQGSAQKEKTAAEKPQEKSNQAKKVVINEVIIKDGRVKMIVPALAGKEISADLPDVQLKNIGKNGEGTSPAEALEEIFSSLYKSISADSVTSVLNEGLKQIGGLKEMGTSEIKGKTDAARKAADAAGESVKSAAEGVKGLFK